MIRIHLALALAALILLLVPAPVVAQSCIPCDQLCRTCSAKGLAPKDNHLCRGGCAKWAKKLGVKVVLVREGQQPN